MISGLIVKTAAVLGAVALGVEYGRRHPVSPWGDLARLLRKKMRDARQGASEKVRARRARSAPAESAPEVGLEDDGRPVPPPGAGADTPAWDPGTTGSQPPPPAAAVGDAPEFPETAAPEAR